MKLIGIEKLIPNRPATATITPEEQDDLWLLYNLISPGDTLSSDTSRKIQPPSAAKSATAKSSVRVKFSATIEAAAFEYATESSTLRVKGKITTSNAYVATGAFHTIDIELNKPFSLMKEPWDRASIETLRSASGHPVGADIGVLLMNWTSARMYLVGRSTSSLCGSVECGASNCSDFFERVFRVFRKFVDFSAIRCMVIGGPGSCKAEFRRYLLSESKRLRLRSFDENKSRIVLVEVSDINKEGLNEVLCDDRAMSLIKDTKSSMEIRAMKELNDLVMGNSGRACYGPKSVDLAREMRAIETLLVIGELVKSRDVVVRQKYVELVKSVRKCGGKVLVYSSMHVSGEKLAQLTGVAAILRFPLPDIEDLEL